MADPSEFPRKTLDDIRRELDAEYPLESEATTPGLVAEGDDAAARRYLTITALAGVGALLLLIVGYVVMSLESTPNALANARESRAPNGAAANPGREPRDARPAAAMASPVIPSELARELKALRSDLKAVADRLDRWDSRIAGMESRVQGMESSMRRLAGDAATAAATRTAAVPQATAKSPPPRVEIAPSAAPLAAPYSGRLIPVKAAAPEIPVKAAAPESATAPHDARPAVELDVPPEPPTPPPALSDVSESRPTSADSNEPATLRQKLRAEWRTIKQGFATAGDDLKAVMRDFGRKASGE